VRAYAYAPTSPSGVLIFNDPSASRAQHRLEAGYALTFKADPAERTALMEDKRFFEPWYWGARGWLALNLETAEPDWTEVAELVQTSYRQVALKRQLKALEA